VSPGGRSKLRSEPVTPVGGEITAAIRPHAVVGNSALLVAARVVSLAVTTGVTIYAVRQVSAPAWGHYATAVALIAIFSVLSDSGIATFALREFSSEPLDAQRTLAIAATAIGATSVVAIAVLVTVPALGRFPHGVVVLVLLACPLVALQPLLSLAYAAFNARQSLASVMIFQVVQALIFGAVGVILVAGGAGVRGLLGANVAATAIAVVLAFWLVRRRLGLRLFLTRHADDVRRCLLGAVPLAGIGVIGIVYDRLDVLLLSRLASASAVAHYNVAYSVVTLSSFVPSIVAATFFPLLNTALQRDRERARSLFLLVVRLFLLISFPIAVLLSIAGGTLITFVFGARYHASGPVIAIMAWTLVLGFQNYVFWYAILAIRRERRVLAILVGGLAVNALMNVVLIPRFGPSGAAATLLVSDFVILASQVPLVHREVFVLPFRRLLLRPILGMAAALAVIVPLVKTNAIGAAGAGVAVYTAVVLLSGYIRRDEWASVLGPVRDLFTRSARTV
jgi:O-antigen/teichoic acid export membrane protein